MCLGRLGECSPEGVDAALSYQLFVPRLYHQVIRPWLAAALCSLHLRPSHRLTAVKIPLLPTWSIQ